MSEVLASLKQKGGGQKYTETILWTNPDTSVDFAAQTVSLSDSISNYKYIAIDYCYNKSNTGITSRVIYDVTDFKKGVKDGSTNHTISGLTIEGANNVNYARPVFYISDTSIAFGLSSTLNGSGTYAAGAIPLEILGINELKHSDGSEIVFTNEMVCTPFRNTTPSGSTLTFTDAGTYLISYWYNGSATDIYPQVVSGTMNIKKASSVAVSVNNFTGTQYKMYQRVYIAEVTAGTEIQGQVATANSGGFAVKID